MVVVSPQRVVGAGTRRPLSGQHPFGFARGATNGGVVMTDATGGVSAREGAELPDVSTSNQPTAAGRPISKHLVGFVLV